MIVGHYDDDYRVKRTLHLFRSYIEKRDASL